MDTTRPLVSVLVPAFNEADVVKPNLGRLCDHMQARIDHWRWELVVVDDGSSDGTGDLAQEFARMRENVRVFRHPRNFRLGQALRTGFGQCRGDIIVVMDLDLTYAPDHIDVLVERMRTTPAKIVVASPYMKGGRSSHVPFRRSLLSRWGNRFLALTARGVNPGGNLSTLTGMVRAYDAVFIRSLNLKSMGAEINIEILYKALIMGACIEEVPAHLDWGGQEVGRAGRFTSMRLGRGIVSSLLAGFIIRPFAFFIIPGVVLALISVYVLIWIGLHVLTHYGAVAAKGGNLDSVLSESIARAFQQSPHAFIVGGITLMLSVQLFSLGVLALQAKQYFEEMFHFNTRVYAFLPRLERMLADASATAGRSDGVDGD